MLIALLLYGVLALLFWGPWVLDDPGSKLLAANDLDPSASTQMFQAFMDQPEPEVSGRRWAWAALVGVGMIGLVAALAWLVLG